MLRLVLIVFLASVGIDDAPVRETRSHNDVVGADGKVFYSVTSIRQSSEKESLDFELIEDIQGQRYVLSRIHVFASQAVKYQLRRLGSDDFVESSFNLPLKAKTRSETAEEVEQHPERMKADAAITVRTAGREGFSTDEIKWRTSDEATGWRAELRLSLPADFVEAVEVMRYRLFTLPGFAGYRVALADYILHGHNCRVEERPTALADGIADCAYDKRFGFPCSVEQYQKVVAASQAKRPLTLY